MSTTRQPAPDVEFTCPDCGICGEETCTADDGGYYCEDCGAYFDDRGRFSGWEDDTAAQCEARAACVIDPPDSRILPRPKRCLLAAGHTGVHRAAQCSEWSDGIPALDATGAGSGWRSITPEQADAMQAAIDAAHAEAVSRG